MFNVWAALSENPRNKMICKKFIQTFKEKFDFELNSSVYSVASILNTAKLYIWFRKSWSRDYMVRAREEITAVAIKLFEKKQLSRRPAEGQSQASVDSFNDEDEIFSKLFRDDTEDKHINYESHSSFFVKLEREKIKFITMIEDSLLANTMSTKSFWLKNRHELPLLSNLALQLNGIPSTSAYVERFFSICKVITKPRAGNLSDSSFIFAHF
jgi:hypothetical protein